MENGFHCDNICIQLKLVELAICWFFGEVRIQGEINVFFSAKSQIKEISKLHKSRRNSKDYNNVVLEPFPLP